MGRTSKSPQNYFCPNFAHNVTFPGKLGNFLKILFSRNSSVLCVDFWNRSEILIDCHKIRGKTSKSQQNHFSSNFAHNVSFSGKLGNFTEILFSQNGSAWCADVWNRIEILIDLSQNQRVRLQNPSKTIFVQVLHTM